MWLRSGVAVAVVQAGSCSSLSPLVWELEYALGAALKKCFYKKCAHCTLDHVSLCPPLSVSPHPTPPPPPGPRSMAWSSHPNDTPQTRGDGPCRRAGWWRTAPLLLSHVPAKAIWTELELPPQPQGRPNLPTPGRAHVIRTRRRGLCLREWRVNPGPLWGNQFLAKARQPCSSPVPRTHHFLSQTPVLSPSPPALSAWPDAYPLVPMAVLH